MTLITKFIGVKKRHGDGNFEARAVISREIIHVGTFKTARDAATARDLYLLENHPNPASVNLNFPSLRTAKSPKMPEATGTVLGAGVKREPLSATGYRYIHEENGKFVFRFSEKPTSKAKRKYFRKQFDSLGAALVHRHKLLGIPVPARV